MSRSKLWQFLFGFQNSLSSWHNCMTNPPTKLFSIRNPLMSTTKSGICDKKGKTEKFGSFMWKKSIYENILCAFYRTISKFGGIFKVTSEDWFYWISFTQRRKKVSSSSPEKKTWCVEKLFYCFKASNPSILKH